MKSTVWVVMLSVITFGIGWTSSRIADDVQSAVDSVDPGAGGGPPWKHGRGEGGRGQGGRGEGSRGSRFPFAGSADEFAEKLELDPAQQDRLAELLAESARRIREHEDSIYAIKTETRSGMLDLLTDAQRVRLDELFAERIRKRSEEHVASALAWFRANVSDLSADTLEGVEAAFVEYEDGKRQYISREYCGGEGEDDERISIDELRAARDERLSALVGADVLEQYQASRSSRWRGGRGGKQ